MAQPQLSEATLRSLTSDQSFARGQEYFHSGAVVELEQRGDTLLAHVEGSGYEPYQVTVKLDAGGIVEAECTCPYDWGGYCKHIVATLLAYIHHPEQVTERPAITTLLADLDRETLIDLVTDLVDKHPHLADWLEAEVAVLRDQPSQRASAGPRERQAPLDPTPFRRQAQAILRGAEDWEAVSGAASQFQALIARIEPFLAAGDGRNALVILEAITEVYVDQWFEFDDSDGELGNVFADLGSAFAEAILSADFSVEERRAWEKKLTRWQHDVEEYGIDEAFDPAIGAAKFGWDYPPLQRAMQGHVTREGAWEGKPPWYADELAVARLNVLERQGRLEEYIHLAEADGQTTRYVTMLVQVGRVQEAVTYGLESLGMADEALTLAQALREHGHLQDALRIAERGLALQGSVTTLARWLRDLASGLGKTDIALKAANAAFSASLSLGDYQAVQPLAGDTWSQLKQELLKHLASRGTSVSAKVDIYVHEGMLDQAIKAIDEERYAWYGTVEKVVDAAWRSHPDWVIRACKKQAEPIMDEGKSQHYHHALRWLSKARQAYLAAGRETEWRVYLEELIAKHTRKRSLRPGLEGLRKQ
jgi:uncharacterized Zn finger protein